MGLDVIDDRRGINEKVFKPENVSAMVMPDLPSSG